MPETLLVGTVVTLDCGKATVTAEIAGYDTIDKSYVLKLEGFDAPQSGYKRTKKWQVLSAPPSSKKQKVDSKPSEEATAPAKAAKAAAAPAKAAKAAAAPAKAAVAAAPSPSKAVKFQKPAQELASTVQEAAAQLQAEPGTVEERLGALERNLARIAAHCGVELEPLPAPPKGPSRGRKK